MGYNISICNMKNVFVIIGCAMLIAVSSCSKKTVSVASGDVEVMVPCSGPEYRTDKKNLRYSAVGLSGDINMAKKKAMAEASAGLASVMNSLVERVATNYVNSYQVGETEEGKQKYEDMAKIVVKQKLSGIKVICEKTMKTPEGKYKVYVAIELGGEELLEGINTAMSRGISDGTKTRIDYDYDKYKKEFDKEMEKLEKQY